MQDKQWYTLSSDEALRLLAAQRSGLDEAEAKRRLLQYGHNILERKKQTPPLLVFLRQFLSPLIYVLLVAALISIVVRDYLDAWVILGVLLLNAIVGFVQEARAERAMEALLYLAAPKATVRREGNVKDIHAREIVPGDILILETGDKVPADARLLDVSNLKVNEAMLTGESMPVDKHTTALREGLPISERKNTVYLGTIVAYGKATALAVRTGMSTEIGKIAFAIQEIKPEQTPLQKSISNLSRFLVIAFLGVSALLVLDGLFKGLALLDMFLLAVAAAVSAIPEGLPAVVTVILAVGMRIMAQHNAIIRKLVAVETLGSATVICSDKTGTLTLNEMTVRRIYVNGKLIEVTGEGFIPEGEFCLNGNSINTQDESGLSLLLHIGALCNDALVTRRDDQNYDIFGDPTEGALLVVAAKAGMVKEKLEEGFPRLDEIPFQSENQYMATLHPRDGSKVVYVKGSVEKLLAASKFILKQGKVVPMTEPDVRSVLQMNSAMAGEAMRVLAVGYVNKPAEFSELLEDDVADLVFVGLVGMADPPREETKEAVRLAREAGIKVVMITGDHKLTAESIARQLELAPGKTVTGTELGKMSDEELSREIEDISVFARIEPLHKLRIVNAFKSRGEVVAMTGDGVNDAPALKAANIGIAMGIKGTDVAKESADMVLADDDFSSVVHAVEEGRVIFNRLRNVLFFLLSTNMGELLSLLVTIFFVGQAPLLPVQIIWNNLVTDTAISIPLGLEPKFGDELKQPPRHPEVGLIFPGLLLRIGFIALLMGMGVFFIFRWAEARMSLEEARTLTFCSFVTFQWLLAFNARSDEHTVFRLGVFKNRLFIGSVGVAILLQLSVIYVPFLQIAFRTVPLGIDRWAIAIVFALSVFLIEELRKLLFPRLFSLGKWRPAKKIIKRIP